MKFDIWVFFENLLGKFKLHWNLTRITGTVPEDRNTFFIISGLLVWMSNVSYWSCREIQNILCSVTSTSHPTPTPHPPKKSPLWDTVEECGTDGQATDFNIIWRMRTACWIRKATNAPTEYVILIDLPLNSSYANAFQYYATRTLSCLVLSNVGILNDHSSKPLSQKMHRVFTVNFLPYRIQLPILKVAVLNRPCSVLFMKCSGGSFILKQALNEQ
jgi:hypothetical protein